MKLSALKNDPRKSTGAWVNQIPGMDGLCLQVKSSTCDEIQRVRAQAIQELPRERRLPGVPMDPADARTVQHKVLKAGLMNWGGLNDDDEAGNEKPIAYTAQYAGQLISDPETEAFAEAVAYAMSVVSIIGVVDLEDAKGN